MSKMLIHEQTHSCPPTSVVLSAHTDPFLAVSALGHTLEHSGKVGCVP